MDTRRKIISLDEAQALACVSKPVTVVTGSFDVLLAAHVRELRDARDSVRDALLLVAVTTPRQPLLEPRARAEMVAALEMVDYVVSLEDREIGCFLETFAGKHILRLEAAHTLRLCELNQHVERRQSR